MIKVIVKVPHEVPIVKEVASTSELEAILGGDIEVVNDDQLEGIHLLVSEEARGIEANNFPVSTDGYLDWVYGTCIFVKQDNSSFTEEEVKQVEDFLAKSK
jgi:hypothetical protein